MFYDCAMQCQFVGKLEPNASSCSDSILILTIFVFHAPLLRPPCAIPRARSRCSALFSARELGGGYAVSFIENFGLGARSPIELKLEWTDRDLGTESIVRDPIPAGTSAPQPTHAFARLRVALLFRLERLQRVLPPRWQAARAVQLERRADPVWTQVVY